jgi:hypothetical protein
MYGGLGLACHVDEFFHLSLFGGLPDNSVLWNGVRYPLPVVYRHICFTSSSTCNL